MPNPPITWRDRVLDILCRLYQTYGKNCADLGVPWPQVISALLEKAEIEGRPPFGTPQEEAEFDKTLEELSAALASPENDASPSENADMQMILKLLEEPPTQP